MLTDEEGKNKEERLTENKQDMQEESEIKGSSGNQEMEQNEVSSEKEEELMKNRKILTILQANPPKSNHLGNPNIGRKMKNWIQRMKRKRNRKRKKVAKTKHW